MKLKQKKLYKFAIIGIIVCILGICLYSHFKMYYLERNYHSIEDVDELISGFFEESGKDVGKISQMDMWVNLKNKKITYADMKLLDEETQCEANWGVKLNGLMEGLWEQTDRTEKIAGIAWQDMDKILVELFENKQLKQKNSCIHIEKITSVEEFEEVSGTYLQYQDNELSVMKDFKDKGECSYVIEITGYEDSIYDKIGMSLHQWEYINLGTDNFSERMMQEFEGTVHSKWFIVC